MRRKETSDRDNFSLYEKLCIHKNGRSFIERLNQAGVTNTQIDNFGESKIMFNWKSSPDEGSDEEKELLKKDIEDGLFELILIAQNRNLL